MSTATEVPDWPAIAGALLHAREQQQRAQVEAGIIRQVARVIHQHLGTHPSKARSVALALSRCGLLSDVFTLQAVVRELEHHNAEYEHVTPEALLNEVRRAAWL